MDLVKEGKSKCAVTNVKDLGNINGLLIEIVENNDGSSEVTIDNEKGVLIESFMNVIKHQEKVVQSINKTILPKLYILNPNMLVIKCNSSSTVADYLKHQLLVFRKLVVVTK